MSADVQCPDHDLLRRYLIGQVTAIEAAMVEPHLTACTYCTQAMGGLDRPLSRLAVARGSMRTADAESGMFRAVERAKQVYTETLAETAHYSSPVIPSQAVLLIALEQSRLLSAQQSAELRCFTECDIESLIAQLIKREWLNSWQAHELLAGRTRLVLGDYRLVGELGRGGMGTVYLAEHDETRYRVALKVIAERRAHAPNAAARFRREVKALGALDHPNLVRAIDTGWEGDLQFLVMEYVPGNDLTRWSNMPVEFCCECIRQAALGLQHAHQRGVVHRDIKPGNLLVAGDEPFARPLVKILDLGLARFSETPPGEESLTGSLAVMGTPDYIAPEQARSSRDADARSDIYSLGCTLYYLLSGRKPFAGKTPLETIMARVGTDATPVHEFRPEIPEGLSEIVSRMMAPEPAARFQTAGEVASALVIYASPATTLPTGAHDAETVLEEDGSATSDGSVEVGTDILVHCSCGCVMSTPQEFAGMSVQCFVCGEHLVVPDVSDSTAVEPLSNWALIAVAAVALCCCVAVYLMLRSPPKGLWFQQTNTQETQTRTPSIQQLRQQLGSNRVVERDAAERRLESIGAPALATLRESAMHDDDAEVRLRSARLLPKIALTLQRDSLDGHIGPVTALACSSNGTQVITGGWDATVRIWNIGTADHQRYLRRGSSRVWAVAISPDGARVASAGESGRINVFSPQSPKNPGRIKGHQANTCTLAFMPDGRRILSGGWDKTVRFWNVDSGRELWRFDVPSVPLRICVSPDGSTVAIGCFDGSIRLFETSPMVEIRQFLAHASPVWGVAVSPDGRRLLTGCGRDFKENTQADHSVFLWDLRTGNKIRELIGHTDGVRTVAFSDDGQLIATGGLDHTMRIWSAKSGEQLISFEGHTDDVECVAFVPGRPEVISSSFDGSVRIWQLPLSLSMMAPR